MTMEFPVTEHVGPGGRAAYVDCGDERFVIHQHCNDDRKLQAPDILIPNADNVPIHYLHAFRDALSQVIEIAEKWNKDTGGVWVHLATIQK